MHILTVSVTLKCTDIRDSWPKIERSLSSLLRDEFQPTLQKGINIYCIVHNFCTARTVEVESIDSSGLLGSELYENLDKYVQLHLQQIWKSKVGQKSDNLVQYYDQQWKRFKADADTITRFFRYLNRHWVKRQVEEWVENVHYIESLLMLRWKESVSTSLGQELVELLLALIQAQRDHTRIPTTSSRELALQKREGSTQLDGPSPSRPLDLYSANLPSLINSVIKSFMFSSLYEEYFEEAFITATTEYYSKEALVSQPLPNLWVPDYAHMVLNRLSVEKSFMPTGTDEMVLEPWLKILHEAFYTPDLEEYYQSIGVQEQIDGDKRGLLVIAGLRAHGDMVKHLVGFGKGLIHHGFPCQTALHSAVLAGNFPLIKTLLTLNAPIDAQNHEKQTPCHQAVITENLSALNCLFIRPDCCTVLDGDGKTIGMLMGSWKYDKLSDSWKEALRVAVRLEGAAWLFKDPLTEEESKHPFHPRIVKFESGIYTSQRKVDLGKILTNDTYYRKEMDGDLEVKWLHLPANNVRYRTTKKAPKLITSIDEMGRSILNQENVAQA